MQLGENRDDQLMATNFTPILRTTLGFPTADPGSRTPAQFSTDGVKALDA